MHRSHPEDWEFSARRWEALYEWMKLWMVLGNLPY